MPYPDFRFHWRWRLPGSPEAMWPLVADTNRFNNDAGVPPVERLSIGAGDAINGRRRLRLFRLGVPVEWDEEPFEWVRPRTFGVRRHYRSGPVAEMRTLVTLEALPAGGTSLTYDVVARPRTALGLLAIPIQIGLVSRRSFGHAFIRYGEEATRGRLRTPHNVTPSAHTDASRLEQIRRRLVADGAPEGMVSRLLAHVEQSDDVSLSRIRPYALADAWGERRRSALELCLLATRQGLLELRWDVLCPLCRGAKKSESSLRDVAGEVHCDVCHIDFSANFDRFVELTFRPNPTVRPIEAVEYCVGGPQVTPHIVAQQLLRPREERTVRIRLEEGRYRARTLALAGGQSIAATAEGETRAALRASSSGWTPDELRVSLNPAVVFANETGVEQLFIVERMAWSDQAATAAEVTALQAFRDLFSSEALRPGQHISVGSLAVAFTDLRGSTRMYRQIGDAPAFGLVMRHFDVLKAAVEDEDGAIVKTIGDAVMAVFRRPARAVRAMLRAQSTLANPPERDRALHLKVGIHYGPCIAVTLNERLDYFGSAVNIAARLEGQSSGSDVIISSTVRDDPEVAAWIDGAGLEAKPLEASLKGLDEERFALWRVSPFA